MKLFNHKLSAAATAWAANTGLLEGAAIVAGAVLPDLIELPFNKHRGYSHHWAIYSISLVLFNHYPLLQLLSIGALVHIVGDSLTPLGVPVGNCKKRLTFDLFSTGSFKEYLMVMLFAVTVYLYKCF